MPRPQGETIWGNINTCLEIAVNIYYIYAERGEGFMVSKDNANTVLSPKAIAMGQEDDEWLCFGEDVKDVPMYELLQRRVAACEKIKGKALAEMQEIKRDGRLRLTDYFGECAPPAETPEGAADKLQKIRNGIYFTQSQGKDGFAVHEAVADNFMSPVAAEYGRREGEYLFYDLTTSAVPIHELRQIFEEVNDAVVSEDSLLATLNSNFRTYVLLYNDIVNEEAQIPPMSAPTSLFLQRQLDTAHQQPAADLPAHQENQHEDDYGEEVGDFFGR